MQPKQLVAEALSLNFVIHIICICIGLGLTLTLTLGFGLSLGFWFESWMCMPVCLRGMCVFAY